MTEENKLQVVTEKPAPMVVASSEHKASEKIEMHRASTQVALAFRLAVERPRSESACRELILTRCADISFAADAMYAKPKGDSSVEGLSVKSAKEFMRIWGNVDAGIIDHGSYGNETQIETFAHDLESNFRFSSRYTASHKFKSGKEIVTASDPERIAELVKSRASKEVRNCMLSILPDDLIESAKKEIKRTIYREVGEVQTAWEGWVKLYAALGVGPQSLLKYVNKADAKKLGADDIYELRVLYNTLQEFPEQLNSYFPFENEFKSSPNPEKLAEDAKKVTPNPVAPAEKKSVATEKPGKQKKASQPADSAAETQATSTDAGVTTEGKPVENAASNHSVAASQSAETAGSDSGTEAKADPKQEATEPTGTQNTETTSAASAQAPADSNPSDSSTKPRLKLW